MNEANEASIGAVQSYYTYIKTYFNTCIHKEEVTRKQRVINKEKKRRLVRSATVHCKFATSKEYIDETSTVKCNEILGLEFSFLLVLLLNSL